jgi:hypothetical protein
MMNEWPHFNNHTGRELELMLAGRKPLSMFYDMADAEPDEKIIPEIAFDGYVRSGQFAKQEQIFVAAMMDPQTGKPHLIRYVFYALKGEEWRIPAIILVMTAWQKSVSNFPIEFYDRLIGPLLGYTEQEVDDFAKNTVARKEAGRPLTPPRTG